MFILNSVLKRRSILTAWLFSYLSILFIPFIIGIIIYFQSEHVILNEINRANTASLDLVQKDIDSKINDVEKLSLQIAFNPNIELLLRNKGAALEPSMIFKVSDIINEIARYNTFKSHIYSFYVLLKDLDKVITPQALYDLDVLYDTYYQDTGLSKEEFKDLTRGLHRKDYIPLKILTGNGTSSTNNTGVTNTIAYMNSLPLGTGTQSNGTIMVLMPESSINETLKNLKFDDRSAVLIINSKNEIITSNKSSVLPSGLKYSELTQPYKLMRSEIGGEKVIISFNSSQINDWKYVSVIPEAIYLQKLKYMRKLTLLGALLCVVLGGFAAYFFAKRNYNPIRELVQAIEKKAGISAGESYNEFRFIRDALSNTLMAGKEVEEKLGRQNSVLRSNFLTRLLKGKYDATIPIQDTLKSLDMKFESEDFAVMLFYLEDFDDMYTNNTPEENLKLVLFIISNVVEELSRRKYYGYMIETDDMLACLINLNQTDLENSKKDLIEIAEEAMEFLKRKFHIYLTISISGIHSTFTAIPKSYQEALEAMEYRMLLEDKKIIHFQDIKHSTGTYYYPVVVEQQLINYIKTGNFEKSQETINEILSANFSKDYPSINIVHCIVFNLISTLIKAMDEIDTTYRDSFIEKLNSSSGLLGCKTVKEMEKQLFTVVQDICSLSTNKKKSHNNQIIEELVEYIENNYHDSNLSVATIADRFDRHPVYLSSYCKEQIGESLLDYINKVRVSKAKLLLKDQKANISEVAKLVGYYNSSALIRAFKKYEGVTPGQYKEVAQNG